MQVANIVQMIYYFPILIYVSLSLSACHASKPLELWGFYRFLQYIIDRISENNKAPQDHHILRIFKTMC